GLKNEVENLELISGARAMAMEPNLFCTAAMWSPETGIIDSHAYMLALQGEIEDYGGTVAFMTPVTRIEPITGGGFRVTVSGVEPAVISCRRVVNSAGLGAQAVARGIEGYRQDLIPKLVLAKGNYFGCSGKPAFSRLIYPAPVEGGLGVHVTLDLAGRMRFGPDVEWIKQMSFDVDARRAEAFYASIRTYWPALPDGSLVPDHSPI